MRISLLWKWSGALTLLLVVLLTVVNLCIDAFLSPLLFNRILADLERDAWLAAQIFQPSSNRNSPTPPEINGLAHLLGHRTGLRVTVIASDGKVVAESDKPEGELARMENHLLRPEVQAALREGVGHAIRHSDTLSVDLVYVAVAAQGGHGVVRVALPLRGIEGIAHRVRLIVAVSSAAVALGALPIFFLMARRTSRPIERMRQMATRVAEGDFSAKAPMTGGVELRELGKALNLMSEQLATRLRQLTRERTELRATLASMVEGVLLVDPQGRIVLVNQALLGLLDLSGSIVGRTALEAFRNVLLHEMIAHSLEGREVRDRELSLAGSSERAFAANAACLHSEQGEILGAVVVLHDITRLKQLENIRKEFVANVSHELRTPLSMIKGYVETLLDEIPPDPATLRNFLATIQKHSNRLEILITDLLTISVLESAQAPLDVAPVALGSIVEAVAEEMAAPARAKSIVLRIELPSDLPMIRANGARLHQVLSNLLDNAVKYTPLGGWACVSARTDRGHVEVCVEDNGCGIAPEHLPHLFERFYRVDRARSREMGGTGLGLSIVKHIVQVHGGRVWVESEPGRGSRFFFTVPIAGADASSKS